MMRKGDSDRAFEAAVESWAKTDFGNDAAIGRILARTDQLAKTAPPQAVWSHGRHGWRKLVSGVGIAASVVVALLVMPGTDPKTGAIQTGAIQEVSVIEVEERGTDSEEDALDSFALLYTPTMEEELYI